ncbi:alkaline-phosphatase-like protein [Obelidium mucronatum]|nr:alkaline-phosphatase-like protein [Obelidium mucronatum]
MSQSPLLPNYQNPPPLNIDDTSYASYVITSLGLSKATGLYKKAVVFGLGAIAVFGVWSFAQLNQAKQNVIMIISDGFGPASQTLARNYNAYVNNLGPEALLPLDHILVGSSRTRSSSSFVTDSAAGATAFSCALKSYNGAIGVNPDGIPCGTILEAAKLRGYLTGLVATSRLTHATPGSFSAHVIDRDMEDEIAVQQIGNYSLGRMVDLAFAGGSCHFKPQTGESLESCRADDKDLFGWGVEKMGWNLLNNVTRIQEFGSVSEVKLILFRFRLPLMGLFTPDHMSYEIDRDPSKEPSLREMAIKALDILSHATKRTRKGFFIMIEGSRIDMAGHSNDPAAHVHEILAYNEMIQSVIEWVDRNPNTIMISTSDHETGGLSVAHQLGSAYPEYAWYPKALTPVQNSTEVLGKHFADFSDKEALPKFITETVLPEWLGIGDASQYEIDYLTDPARTSFEYSAFLARMISDRAGLGWATTGHSAVDVNLYAHGRGFEALRGNHENTDIGLFMERKLGLDLKSVTSRLTGATAGVWWERVMSGYEALSGMKEKTVKGFQKVHYHQKQRDL